MNYFLEVKLRTHDGADTETNWCLMPEPQPRLTPSIQGYGTGYLQWDFECPNCHATVKPALS